MQNLLDTSKHFTYSVQLGIEIKNTIKVKHIIVLFGFRTVCFMFTVLYLIKADLKFELQKVIKWQFIRLTGNVSMYSL